MRPLLTDARWLIPLYGGAIALAELSSLWIGPALPAALHALLLLLLVTHWGAWAGSRTAQATRALVTPPTALPEPEGWSAVGGWQSDAPGHLPLPGSDAPAALLALALLPLLRLLSLTMALPSLPQLFWYPLVGAPLLLALWLAARALELERRELGFGPGGIGWPLLIGLSGLPLGLLAAPLLPPNLLGVEATATSILLLALFVALPEELLFRALLPRTLVPRYGPGGHLLAALAYALMHVGSGGATFMVALLLALLLGAVTAWRGRLLGAILAHTLFLAALLLAPQLL